MSERQRIVVGIDLGVSNSSISFHNPQTNEVEIIMTPQGTVSIPSYVSFSRMAHGEVHVGDLAKNDPQTEYVVFDAKRFIGLEKQDVDYSIMNYGPFSIIGDNPNDPMIGYVKLGVIDPTGHGDREYFYPEEIEALIIMYLKQLLEERVPNPEYEKVVVSVPASFNDNQRRATIVACQLAGFENVVLVNSSVAAIVDYQRETRNRLNDGNKVVVIDFGGGSLDIACCEVRNGGEIHVIEEHGKNHLGGNDFDRALMELIVKKMVEEGFIENENEYLPSEDDEREMTNLLFLAKRTKVMRLRKVAERAKITLSKQNVVEIDVCEIMSDGDPDNRIELTRREFEEACEELLEDFNNELRTITCQTGFHRQNIDLFVFVGKTSLIPAVSERVTRLFPRSVIANDAEFDMSVAVCKGACFYGLQNREDELERVVVNRYLNHSLGIDALAGGVIRLFEAGTPIPTPVVTKTFMTVTDYQESLRLNLFSGESQYAHSPEMKNCGTLIITNIPRRPRLTISIEISFQVDENELINVTVRILSQGNEIRTQDMTVTMTGRRLPEELQRMRHHVMMFTP